MESQKDMNYMFALKKGSDIDRNPVFATNGARVSSL